MPSSNEPSRSTGRAEAAPAADADAGGLQVELAWSPGPLQLERVALTLPAGATVEAAWQAACARCDGLAPPRQDGTGLSVGIWGRACALERVLADGDRVEIYRGLKADPKESRRVRYQAHLARWGGRRPVGKKG